MSRVDALKYFDDAWAIFWSWRAQENPAPLAAQARFGDATDIHTEKLPRQLTERLHEELNKILPEMLDRLHAEVRERILREIVEEARATLTEFEPQVKKDGAG